MKKVDRADLGKNLYERWDSEQRGDRVSIAILVTGELLAHCLLDIRDVLGKQTEQDRLRSTRFTK